MRKIMFLLSDLNLINKWKISKKDDFPIFQKLFQIVYRVFPCTLLASCDPETTFSMGANFHNLVCSPGMCRALHIKIRKMLKNLEK